MVRPPRLRQNDKISIVAPSGPVPRESFEAGAAILARRYRLAYDERIFARAGFLAGPDDARAEALAEALADPETRAVVCARGGYGLTRILDRLDAAAFARAPKLIVGFSDVTALLAWAALAGVTSIHAPVVTQLGSIPVEDRDSLFALLESDAPPPAMTSLRALTKGHAEGVLAGGNLEVLSRLCGTPWQPKLDGTVLVLEDIGERPYRLDRALTQLAQSHALDGVRAIVCGEFVRCADTDGSGPSAEEVIVERLARLGLPIVAGAPVGHGARNRAFEWGTRVRVDATRARVDWLV